MNAMKPEDILALFDKYTNHLTGVEKELSSIIAATALAYYQSLFEPNNKLTR